MREKLLLLLLLPVYFAISCGNSPKEYKFIYLNYQNQEMLYVFRGSEEDLCFNEEISICQNKYSISDSTGSIKCDKNGCRGSVSMQYFYLADNNIVIGISYEDYVRSIIASNNDGQKVVYQTNIDVTPRYRTGEYISSTQYSGYCDAKFFIEFIYGLLPKGKSVDISVDMNSLAMNPDVCKFSLLFNCLVNIGIDLKNGTDELYPADALSKVSSCIFLVYSQDELRLNGEKMFEGN